MQRPTYIDLSAASSRAPSSTSTVRTDGRPSPRIHHYDGDIPPILSPLDAFAAESRRLAKELEATRLAGERRMSRLPPQVITKSLSKHQASRPTCFRSLSNNSTDSLPAMPKPEAISAGSNIDVNEPSQRPKSSYPRISAVPDDEQDDEDDLESHHEGTQHEGEFYATPREYASGHSHDYFGEERTHSPANLSARDAYKDASHRPFSALQPPNAPFAKARSYQDNSDDDYTSSNAGSTFSAPPRKSSNGSGMSYTTSPALQAQHGRTPSNKSEVSLSSLSRVQQLNYSRPISQASSHRRTDSPTNVLMPWLERKPSHLSDKSPGGPTSFEDNRSVMSDGFVSRPSSSYTHKKFVLPRGKLSEKASQRVSQLFAGLSGPTFGWNEPVFPGTPPLSARTDNGFFDHVASPVRPSFDPGRPSLDPGRPSIEPNRTDPRPGLSRSQTAIEDNGFAFGFEQRKADDVRPSSSHTAPDPELANESPIHKPFALQNASSFDHSKMPALPPIPGSTADDVSGHSSLRTRSERSASTVRPTTARSQSDYQAFSPEEHVDKAIELHQNGNLKESTYHLRIAAKANNPTGMLLYALACRHGWGMRANPKEGVALLRRAVDIAMQDVTKDTGDALTQRHHRAQFALAIYELGISHLNGWGVEMDKVLALRCFEIAGSWGDADALTEAGFCYAEGIGCKKNLKKAAKFYRMAAEKGVSMVGNSWIYKDKYNDEDDRPARMRKGSTEKKPRDKSRTRSIFGRKRGTTVTEKEPSQPRE